MKFVIVWTDIGSEYTSYATFHFGVGSLATMLKSKGHEVEAFVPTRLKPAAEYARHILSLEPEMVGFSVMTVQWPYDAEIITELKKLKSDLPIIVGGYHPSLAPEEVIAHPGVDYVVRGEGEFVLVELLEKLQAGADITTTKGLWLKSGGEIIQNPMAPYIADLDLLPDIDSEIFDPHKMFKGRAGSYMMMAGRGCPYSCTYCCNPAFRCMYGEQGFTTRFRSVGRVIGEMQKALEKWPELRFFDMGDEVFTLHRPWFEEFLTAYEEKIHMPMSVMLRADNVDYELLAWMRRVGIFQLRFGIEHGDEEFRRKVLNRRMSNAKLAEVFAWADELGFESFGYIMVGLPHETPELAEKTVDFVRELKLCDSQVSIYYPFPKTKLYDECVARGWYEGERPFSYFDHSTLNMPQFPPEEIKAFQILLEDVCAENQVAKKKFGYCDFLQQLDEAEITAEEGFVGGSFFFLVYPPRGLWLMAHPPARILYRTPITDPTFLNLSVAMHPDVFEQPGGGVRFIVTVDGKEVFNRAIDPKSEPSHRGYQDLSIDLSRYAGSQRTVELITEPYPGDDNRFCTAAWGRVHLAEEPWATSEEPASFFSSYVEGEEYLSTPFRPLQWDGQVLSR